MFFRGYSLHGLIFAPCFWEGIRSTNECSPPYVERVSSVDEYSPMFFRGYWCTDEYSHYVFESVFVSRRWTVCPTTSGQYFPREMLKCQCKKGGGKASRSSNSRPQIQSRAPDQTGILVYSFVDSYVVHTYRLIPGTYIRGMMSCVLVNLQIKSITSPLQR